MERLVTISGFIATRMLQSKLANMQAVDVRCEQGLSTKAWKLLWRNRVGSKRSKVYQICAGLIKISEVR